MLSIYAQLIYFFDSKYQKISEPLLGAIEEEFRFINQSEGKIDYLNVFQDVFNVYSSVMTSRKLILERIDSENCSQYFRAPEHLLQTLNRLKKVKKLFILTHLDLDFTDFVLQNAIPGYIEVFDYIIINKTLQKFFFEQKPFRKYY